MVGWLKVKNGAKYAGVSERTFRPWLRSGLRHIRLKTGTILIKVEWIDEYLLKHEVVKDDVESICNDIFAEMDIS